MTTSEQVSAEVFAERELDDALIRAANLMDLADATDEESHMELAEARYHCGTCVVRTVMDEVWPAMEAYFTAKGADSGE